jgi:hypothetical protein
MIIAFENAIGGLLGQSMAAGAASLSDSSIRASSAAVLVVVLDVDVAHQVGGQVVVVGLLAILGAVGGGRIAAGLDGLLGAGHEEAQDLLGDLEAALQLEDRLGRGLEHHDVVRALAVAVDGIRESATAPGRDLDDLPARGDDVARGAVDDRGGLLIRRVRPDDEHEFIAAHGLHNSFQWDSPR